MRTRLVVGVLIVLIAMGATWAIVLGNKSPEGRRAFDAERWRSVDGRTSPERLTMIDDLVESKLLIGKTVAEVQEMLGQAEPVNYFENAGYDIMYVVGEGRGLLPGPEYLAIDISSAGTVQSIDVLQD
jgi:hypothetical protein